MFESNLPEVEIESLLDPLCSSPICAAYRGKFGLVWDRPTFVDRQGEGRYFASAEVPLRYVDRITRQETGLGTNATFLVFRPGDGTGTVKDYKLDELDFFPSLPRSGSLEKLIPRLKKGIVAEACLPILTLLNERVCYGVCHLNELSLSPDFVVHPAGFVGINREQLDSRVVGKVLHLGGNGERIDPELSLTVGYNPLGERVGDPHAIFNNTPYTQVVAFVALKEGSGNVNLAEILRRGQLFTRVCH